MNHPATVWAFDDAPEELQHLSTNGGDEDWIAEIPDEMIRTWVPPWLYHLDTCHNPQEHKHPTKPGWTVWIGAHA